MPSKQDCPDCGGTGKVTLILVMWADVVTKTRDVRCEACIGTGQKLICVFRHDR